MIEKINNNKPDKLILNHAVDILKRGGVLVIPTETAYGLAADATNKKAIMKIYKIKGRTFNKFLPLIANSINQINKYFKVGKKELELLRKYKGLTVILGFKIYDLRFKNIYKLKGQNSAAVRISTNKVANLLANKLGRPITATSANLSGGENCYSIGAALGQLSKQKYQPDLILDAGKLKKRKPSTIVKVQGNKIKLLRQGEIRIKI
jgi:L-threonylcarbamoyladenylate synthase